MSKKTVRRQERWGGEFGARVAICMRKDSSSTRVEVVKVARIWQIQGGESHRKFRESLKRGSSSISVTFQYLGASPIDLEVLCR